MRERDPQFAFAGTSGLAWGSTGPVLGFGLPHRHLCPIHLNVQVRNRRAGNGREVELLGAPDIFLLSGLNIFSDRFGYPLDRFSRNVYAGQELHLVPALSEGRLAAHRREHAPHAWGEVCLVDVELNVGRELSLAACGTQVVGAIDLCPTHSGEYRPRTHSFIFGRMTTSTRNASMSIVRWWKAQQLGYRIRAGLVDGGANRHLHGREIQVAGLVLVGEDPLKLMF